MEFEDDPAARVAAWDWPRSYRLSPLAWVLRLLASLLLATLAAWMGANTLLLPFGPPLPGGVNPAWFAAGTAALAALAAANLVAARRTRVVLHRDRIEVHGLGGTLSIGLTQILGWRRAAHHIGGPYWATNHPAQLRLRLPAGLSTDLAFSDWVSRIADLDQQEQEASMEKIAADPSLGATPEERLERVARASLVADWLLPVAAIGLCWLAFWMQPRPLLMLALGLLPWLVIGGVVASRGVLRLGGSLNDIRPNLAHFLGLACLALVPSVFLHVNWQDWPRLALATAGTGLCLLGLVLPLTCRALGGDRQTATRALTRGLGLCWVLYAGAALVWTTVLSEPRSTQVHQTVATYKQAHLNRYRLFRLSLDPWGPWQETRQLNVSQVFFNGVSPGERVCVFENTAWWGARWSEVALCEPDAAANAGDAMPAALRRALKLRAHQAQDQGPLMKWLYEGRYAELDGQLNALQAQYEQGQVDPAVLLATYRDFYNPDPDLKPHFAGWKQAFPRSYAAALAHGIHLKFQAEALGAAGFEKWVSPEFNTEAFLDQQIELLEASTRLTPRPTLSYVHLMDAGMHRRERKAMRRWLDQGLASDPQSLLLPRKYLVMLRPMFGGSIQEMQDFVDECHRKNLPRRTLDTLDALMRMQRAWAAQRAGREDDALALFKEAAALEPFSDDLNVALMNQADILVRRQQFEAAAAVLDRAVQARPDNARGHSMRGHALERLGRNPEALQSYRRAADLGDSWSQVRLGTLHLQGGLVERDEAAAARWLKKAADQGDADAKRLLREHPRLRQP